MRKIELDATIVGIGDHQTSGRQPSWLTDLLGTGSHASFEPNVRLRMTEEGSGTDESENDGRTKTKTNEQDGSKNMKDTLSVIY